MHAPWNRPNRKEAAPPRASRVRCQVVAALGGLAAICAQVGWWATLDATPPQWWPYVAGLLLASTAWLALGAWHHALLARGGCGTPAALGCLVRCGAADLAVGVMGGAVLARGADSRVLAAGLWIVPPLLVMFGVVSAVHLMLLGWDGSADRSLAAPAAEPSSPTYLERWRSVTALLVILALGALATRPLPAEHHPPEPRPAGSAASAALLTPAAELIVRSGN